MSEVVLGVGASHSTLMHTHRREPATEAGAARYEEALACARDAVASVQPDAVVVVGSNHFRGLWLDLLPAFTIGVGECLAMGEAGTPKGPLPVDATLARHVCRSLVADEFDVAFSLRLQVDHGVSHAVQHLLAGLDVPIVPVLVNVFAPPLPSLHRCDALGRAIARAIAADGANKRVVVIGSGGLSHRLPFPNWEAPHGEGERFLVEAWLEGRGRWEEYDARRRELTVAAQAWINPEFDRWLLGVVERGEMGELSTWTTERLGEAAGNGGQEIRTWAIASAIAGHPLGRQLGYEPIEEWLTGMGVALMDPTAGRLPSSVGSERGAER